MDPIRILFDKVLSIYEKKRNNNNEIAFAHNSMEKWKQHDIWIINLQVNSKQSQTLCFSSQSNEIPL